MRAVGVLLLCLAIVSHGRTAKSDELNQLKAMAEFLLSTNPAAAFSVSQGPSRLGSTAAVAAGKRASRSDAKMNIFGEVFDQAFGGEKLEAQEPYEKPLLPSLVKTEPSTYKLQEKLFSLSGEDFKVMDVAGEEILRIDGGNVNLGGMVVDKLAFKDMSGTKLFSVERRMMSASTCYDIYSPDGSELIAKIEREWLSMTPKYQWYYEGDDNPFGDFYAEGSFSDRTYTFKTPGGMQTIARVARAPEVFRDVDGYAVEVASGVDAAAILAMAVVIDEDHDEADAKKQQEEGGFPNPFR